ncbi:KinB-signaling pathway activation protein [Salirhabdus salicampi]|uniref:KinB-signaling pathway activation protein n=1 Tax=Salirhabdus salicampi TaxID=476102 RepID=UPI0020C3D6FC|nr:KinB-signaling pathway activation protein [Salirhabdus salicampi]
MTSRKWVRLFLTTLLLGAVATIVTSFFVKADSYTIYLSPLNIWEIFGTLLWFTGIGFIFSLVSQMGFFAYLTVNQFGLSMFRRLWKPIQVFLIAFTLFDLVYIRYKGAEGDVPLYPYIVTAAVIFIYGYAVAYVKALETNKRAFIPALFFMVVITIIEWVPVLRTGDPDWIMLMIVSLLTCNTYQLLVLHRIVEPSQQKEDGKNDKKSSRGKHKKDR